MKLHIDNVPASFDALARRLEDDRILQRIWAHDPSVWSDAPDEIVNRLDWLHLPFAMQRHLESIQSFAQEIAATDIEHVLLLGMGGSSLAPETFSRIYGSCTGSPKLVVLDSTHPQAILDIEAEIDLAKTLVIVATKSGGTTETLSLYRYFFGRMRETVGAGATGARFVAITDPGSRLVDIAHSNAFRKVFTNNPNIGGRYSALSHFGLVPAALCGIDVSRMLASVSTLIMESALATSVTENVSAELGLTLAAAATEGRNKLTFVLPPAKASFGDWVEQLIAESTGKQGRGIVPVVQEQVGSPETYRCDRVFVAINPSEPVAHQLEELRAAGHPIITMSESAEDALPRLMYVWELATALAGHILMINPFDQPNVESAKVASRSFVDRFRKTGEPPETGSVPLDANTLREFIARSNPRYFSIQAYLPPSRDMNDGLAALRERLRKRTCASTTSGYGPRFLHSTGQLHKGDSGEGAFIQLVSPELPNLPIPQEDAFVGTPLSFGALISAQAAGDRAALEQAGRHVITFDVSSPRQLMELAETL